MWYKKPRWQWRVYSHASSITACVMASDKDNKMHSNFRHHHRHTHTRTHVLARFMFSLLSCLYRSQLLVSSTALSAAKLEKNSPLLWLIKHKHSAALSLPSALYSSLLCFPSNPISNSPLWQLKMCWWKLCKCALFVMLFFCIHSTSCLFNTPKQWRLCGLGSKGDSCTECMPGTLTEGVWFSDLDTPSRISALEKLD